MFVINQPIDIVIVGKAFVNLDFMFYNPTAQIVRDARIKCGAILIGQDIYIKVVVCDMAGGHIKPLLDMRLPNIDYHFDKKCQNGKLGN